MIAERMKKPWRLLAVLLLALALFTACSSKAEKTQEKAVLGQKYLTELNYTEAVASFTEAIGLDPENIPAYMGRAQAYVGLEQYEEAKADYTTVIEKTEDQPYTQAEAYVGRAEVNELTTEDEEALNDYEAASTALDRVDLEKFKDVTEQMLEALKEKVREACERLRELFSQNEAEEAEEAEETSVVSYSYSTDGDRYMYDGEALADSTMTVSYQIGGNLITLTEDSVVYDENDNVYSTDRYTMTFTLSQPLKAVRRLRLDSPYETNEYLLQGVEFTVPAETEVTYHAVSNYMYAYDGIPRSLEWDKVYIYEGDEIIDDDATTVTIPEGKSYKIFTDELENIGNVTFTAD